jgi:hypothetical protein
MPWTLGAIRRGPVVRTSLGTADLPNPSWPADTLATMTTNHPYGRELGAFLRARRSWLRQRNPGLESGGRRKVNGLRREGFSLPAESRHKPEHVPDTTRRLLRTMRTPAAVLGRHLDLLAYNDLALALFDYPDPFAPEQYNVVMAMLQEAEWPDRHTGWESSVMNFVGMLRAAVAADPSHPRAVTVVGELSIRSAPFRQMWARQDVPESARGSRTVRHPAVGEMTLDWDTYPLPGNPGPVLLVFTAEPGSPDDDRLRLLASLRARP